MGFLSNLTLNHFRSFSKKTLELSSGTTVIVGPNASGKTNLMEAVYLLSTGKSFRARLEEEMVKYQADLARVRGKMKDHSGEINLEVILTRGLMDVGQSQLAKIARKRLQVGEIPRRLVDFAGNLKVVLFGPWDLDLVTGSPSQRRGWLDQVLSQVDREYRRASLSYEKGLRQRNRILWRIREDSSVGSGRSQLLFWNQLLIKNGDYLSRKREELIAFANTGSTQLPTASFELEYDKSVISEARLQQYAQEEMAAATTLVGPHRDDVVVKIRNGKQKTRNLATYGSRGEQRMGVLWLKLNELKYSEKITEEKPTLLLDDIFSELDHEHREVVIGAVNQQQTIITTADPHYLKGFGKVERIDLKA